VTEPAVFVFDLDGTLVDSLPDMLVAMNKLLADLGRPEATPDQICEWVGDGAAILVERALTALGGMPERPLGELTAAYIAHYRGHAAHASKPYPGVVETLEQLAAAGHPMAVCTNKPHALAIELLEGLGMLPLFQAVLGGDSVPAKKPNPGHLTATLAALKAEGRKALMVGDTRNDVLSARGAGIPVVAVSFGYGKIDARDLGADAVIDDFTRLPGVAAALL
jgi:phosphoglycolate phosphatase